MAIFEAGVTFSKAHHFGKLQPFVFGGVAIVSWRNLIYSKFRWGLAHHFAPDDGKQISLSLSQAFQNHPNILAGFLEPSKHSTTWKTAIPAKSLQEFSITTTWMPQEVSKWLVSGL